jgi:hypothetical protein
MYTITTENVKKSTSKYVGIGCLNNAARLNNFGTLARLAKK